jgi:hypothetical protein
MLVHRWLGQIAEGELPFIRPFRKGDEFKELQVEIAKVVEALKTRDLERQNQLAEFAALAQAGLQGDEKTCRRTLNELTAQLEALGVSGPSPVQRAVPAQPTNTTRKQGVASEPSTVGS